mmetsp:Transcript_18346/g.61707  ORF Transcript_18346/g.61707 Transcript_18346/m.61707 type:complete len:243 (-) Transcript_18346:123-851(-)
MPERLPAGPGDGLGGAELGAAAVPRLALLRREAGAGLALCGRRNARLLRAAPAAAPKVHPRRPVLLWPAAVRDARRVGRCAAEACRRLGGPVMVGRCMVRRAVEACRLAHLLLVWHPQGRAADGRLRLLAEQALRGVRFPRDGRAVRQLPRRRQASHRRAARDQGARKRLLRRRGVRADRPGRALHGRAEALHRHGARRRARAGGRDIPDARVGRRLHVRPGQPDRRHGGVVRPLRGGQVPI